MATESRVRVPGNRAPVARGLRAAVVLPPQCTPTHREDYYYYYYYYGYHYYYYYHYYY